MIFLRIFQVVFILFCFLLVGLGMVTSSSNDEAARASMWLLLEGVGAGLLTGIIGMIVISRIATEGFLSRISTLLFLSLGIFTGVWTAISVTLGIHANEKISLIGRAVKIGFGFLAGWFVVIAVLYVIQLFQKATQQAENNEE